MTVTVTVIRARKIAGLTRRTENLKDVSVLLLSQSIRVITVTVIAVRHSQADSRPGLTDTQAELAR